MNLAFCIGYAFGFLACWLCFFGLPKLRFFYKNLRDPKKRSERAACKAIGLAEKMTDRDLKQIGDYYFAVKASRKQ